jgi:hypothetical protein
MLGTWIDLAAIVIAAAPALVLLPWIAVKPSISLRIAVTVIPIRLVDSARSHVLVAMVRPMATSHHSARSSLGIRVLGLLARPILAGRHPRPRLRVELALARESWIDPASVRQDPFGKHLRVGLVFG